MQYNKIVSTNLNIINYFKEDPLLFYHIKKNIVNIDKTKSEPAFRAYKDESTSCFVSVFMEDEDILNYFIYYNFQVLHYFIMANINESLSDNNEVLKYDEDIFIIFKGGNVMHFYFNKIIEAVKRNLTNPDQSYIKKINDLDKNFKTSDVDTSIFIVNNNEQKFNLIYYHVSILLIKSLLFIRENFDKILNKTETFEEKAFIELPTNLVYVTTYNDPAFDLYTIHTLYKNIVKIFENCIVNNDSTYFVTDLLTNITKFYQNNQFYIFKDCYIGSRYIAILQMIKFYYNKNNDITIKINSNSDLKTLLENIDNIILNQNETILILLNNKLSILNDFYTEEKVQKFLTKLLNKLNSEDYQNKSFFNQLTTPTTEYIINEPVQANELTINSRNDFLFRSVNSIYYSNLVLFNSTSNHYISVNNIISNYVSKEHVVIFDLYRVKFSVLLNKIYNSTLGKNINMYVPSEFLDISIPKFYDFNLCQLREKIYGSNNYVFYFSKLDNNKLQCYNVLTTNLKYTIKDLNTVLYEQNTFIPWNDLKYNKRIIRLLFLIFIVYYKKAVIFDCIDLVDNALNAFIDNLKNLSDNIKLWFADRNNVAIKNNILAIINNIILFNNENNLLNVYTLCNFFDYQNKLFFKIKYYENTAENKILSEIFHGELDLSINVMTKIIFYIMEDYDIYKEYILTNLNNYNYVFNSENDKNNYVDNTFLSEYVEFCEKFVENIIFMKELVFDNMRRNINMPVDDLLLGGSKSFNLSNFINFKGKSLQFSNSKFTDIPFKSMKNYKYKNNNNNLDLEDIEMIK